MRALLSSALLTALSLAVLPTVPQSAHAGAGVMRCAMPDGSYAYTNKACTAFGATSAPLPGDVLSRIERERRREAALTGTDTINVSSSTPTSSVPRVTARRSLLGGCANSPQQLAMDLQAAVATGDVNRVAESYHWAGMGNAAAQRIMLRLDQLASRPMLSVEYFDANIGSLASFADAAAQVGAGDAGMLEALVGAGSGTQVVDFSVQRHLGCYFVRY